MKRDWLHLIMMMMMMMMMQLPATGCIYKSLLLPEAECPFIVQGIKLVLFFCAILFFFLKNSQTNIQQIKLTLFFACNQQSLQNLHQLHSMTKGRPWLCHEFNLFNTNNSPEQ
ncbi:conserved hypothetical protein [Trichinella spiralis]|uniref:hypothetical protein n=1 Tax=Trichinella spiralis TaxID=6334 RepID=UPI0001EFD6FA|nr:conserved hypothetical protein [Trichinella spiralis]